MVVPLIPIAIAGLGGGAVGGLLSGIFGSKKEELMQEQAGKIDILVEGAKPYAHYHPSMIYQPTPTYTYTGGDVIIESPGARTTKKTVVDVAPTADLSAVATYPTTVSPTQALAQEAGIGEGVNITHIAIIAAVGLVAYGLVSKSSPVRRK